MDAISKLLQDRRGQGIHIDVGSEKPIMGTIKDVSPEYLIIVTNVSNERFVMMGQVRWFEFMATRRQGESAGI